MELRNDNRKHVTPYIHVDYSICHFKWFPSIASFTNRSHRVRWGLCFFARARRDNFANRSTIAFSATPADRALKNWEITIGLVRWHWSQLHDDFCLSAASNVRYYLSFFEYTFFSVIKARGNCQFSPRTLPNLFLNKKCIYDVLSWIFFENIFILF